LSKTDVTQWDTTAGNNTDIAGINIAENCAAAGINDALRTVMSQIATWLIAASGPLLKTGGAVTGAITGMLTGSTVQDGTGTARYVGYRSLPISRSVTASTTVTLADEGMMIKSTTGGLIVPNNATLALPIGFMNGFYNDSTSAQSITGGSSVVFQISASTQSSVSVPQHTRAFTWQSAANTFVVSGKNLT
jgi:hypothetical protein